MNDQSLSNNCIRLRMANILKALIDDRAFVPHTVIFGFKSWVEDSGMTKMDKEIVANASREILNEFERRVRWVRQELKDEVFRNQ
jgi:hypothetical protein